MACFRLTHLVPQRQEIRNVLVLESSLFQHVRNADLCSMQELSASDQFWLHALCCNSPNMQSFCLHLLQTLQDCNVRLERPHDVAVIRNGQWDLASFLIVSIREYRSKLARSVSMPFTMRRLAPATHQRYLAEFSTQTCQIDGP